MGPEPRRPASVRTSRGLPRAFIVAMTLWMALSLTLIPSSTLGAPACALVPQLRDVTINQGLGSYPKLVQGKETLVRAYLSLPSCASSTNAIRIVGGALTVRAGTLTNTVQAPFPSQLIPYPLISPNYKTTPPVDSPGDPKWVVPGSFLDPSGATGFNVTFSITISYQSAANGTSFGPTQQTPALTKFPGTTTDIGKTVERETNPLRVLVVPVGNAALNYASQYSTAANEQVQLAMQTISRTFPVADGTGELTATTGGVRFTVDPTLIDIRSVLDTDGLFCLRGSSFDSPIKAQLQTLAQEWETENPGLQIDVAVAVIDPAISKGGVCAQGLAVAGSTYTSTAGLAVARMVPDQGGATLAMEIAHALGMVPAGRGRAGDPSHSPVTAADAGSNRGYNVRNRSFLADDRTALYNSGTGFTNTSTLMEQLDYQFLLCALGGSTTTDCANPGLVGNNVPSGPRFVMSGTVAPSGLSIVDLVVAYSANVPGTPPGTSGPFTLQQINVPTSGPPGVIRTDFVPVSFGGTHHGDGPHAAGVFDVAVPFNADADRIEFRNGATVLRTFDASEVPELTSFDVTPAGESNYTESDIDDESPAVSPDGEWIAWTEDPGGEDLSQIEVGPIDDSSAAVELTDPNPSFSNQSQYEPAWRADGEALALISDGDLWIVDVDTSSGTPVFSNLTFVTGYDEIDGVGLFTNHPSWSPDGSQIAFDADGAIFVVDAVEDATGDETQLTFTGDASYPSWSMTDGDARIAYQRTPPVFVALAGTLMSYVEPVVEEQTGPASHGGNHFLVTSADDVNDGVCNATHCSLREAIIAANSTTNLPAAPDQILFGVGTGPITIQPTSALPTISDPAFIDGTSQPGWVDVPIVVLDGDLSTASDGLVVTAGDSEIRGLVISGWTDPSFFGNGIVLRTNGGNVIAGNYVGLDSGGISADPNDNGIRIESSANTIGGSTIADRNVISGNQNAGNNGAGIIVSLGGANVVAGNYIGTDAAGTGALANNIGMLVSSSAGNTIGGLTPAERNVISGNDIVNLFIGGSTATGNDVVGNYIGPSADGDVALGNAGAGIRSRSPNNFIGGDIAGAGNVISGNAGGGIEFAGDATGSPTGNVVQRNLIGVAADGTTPMPNSGQGIGMSHGNNDIGGVGGNGNVIAYNASRGIFVASGTGSSILGNSIHDNGGLGIDLPPLGVTGNDAGDGDTGANGLQNFPVLSSATDNGATATIGGSLNSVASQTYRIEFFRNAICDASGNGEGKAFIGSQDVTTDAGGNASFTAVLAAPDVAAGDRITATATDPTGSTSEFSACLTATGDPASFEVNSSADTTDPSGCTVSQCTLREAMTRANAEAGTDTITFDIPGSGPHVISLSTSLPTITQGVVIDGTSQPGYAVGFPQVHIAGAAVGGGSVGIDIGASGVTIRGLVVAEFADAGIVVNGANVVIEANLIGGVEQGNGGHGVLLESGSQIAVGGPTAAQANEISENGGAGIAVLEGADFNPLRGNSIHDNGGLGIDLGADLVADGVTPNDSLDADDGGNDEMNFPRILTVTFDGAETTITGDLDSEDALATPTIDLYSNSSCDPTGNGEGEAFEGSTTIPVGLDENGHGDWTIVADGDLSTTILTATASDVTPQTSEFSRASCRMRRALTVNTTDDDDDGACTVAHCSLREAILRANAEPNGEGADVISFNIPGVATPTAPHVIGVGAPLPEITETVAIDGTTEPDFQPVTDVPIVQIDGAALTDDTTSGLVLSIGTSSIRRTVDDELPGRRDPHRVGRQ